MARKVMLVSDLSGKAIEDGKAAKVKITYDDARRGQVELDLTAQEADEWAKRGRKSNRRGRRPRSEHQAS